MSSVSAAAPKPRHTQQAQQANTPQPLETHAQHQQPGTPLPFVGFRPDVQGLRAVAVGVVLLYHAGASFMPGGFVGVDVFFVISGYLITGLLLREALSVGRISLAGFYAKRVRRILPAATVVLVTTLLLTVAFLPQIRWRSIATEAAGAAAYVVNWVLAGSTDYLNANVAPSPIQHFWTLSVEEQFYIVWPLMLIGALWFAMRASKRRGGGLRRISIGTSQPSTSRVLRFAGIGVLAILIPSLAWSIFYTAANPAPAYFVTTTRLWELAIGAAVAVYAPAIARIPAHVGYLLGWAGLAGIVVASVFYTASAPAFPGSAALLPTLSSAAIIAGGMSGRAELGVGRLLSIRPMRWVGDISYSLYLWHWPLIVVGTYLLGGTLSFGFGLLIAVFSIVPAWLSYRYLETPFRNWPRLKESVRRSLEAGGGLAAVSVAMAVAVFVSSAFIVQGLPKFEGQAQGAKALTSDYSDPDPSTFSDAGAPVDVIPEGITPSDLEARDDNPEAYREGCLLDTTVSQPKECVLGDPLSDTTVALVGDSHAGSFIPAMDAVAKAKGWRLVTYTKAACSFANIPQTHGGQAFPQCDEWNQEALDELRAEKPALVVTVNAGRRGVWQDGKALDEASRYTEFKDALRSNWSELNADGIPVAVITDTPEMGIDVPECVSANPNKLSECAVPKEQAVDERPHPEEEAAQGLPETELIDMNNWLCPDDKYCPPVVGNVLVWRDNQHLTATFAATLAKPLEAELDELSIVP